MPRVKRGTKARRRKKRVLKNAKGYYGRKKAIFRRASEAVERAWVYAYRDRKAKKGEFKSLWIQRVNAGARALGLNYSQLVSKLKKAKIALNRKMLAELAAREPATFEAIVKKAAS